MASPTDRSSGMKLAILSIAASLIANDAAIRFAGIPRELLSKTAGAADQLLHFYSLYVKG